MVLRGINRTVWGTRLLLTPVLASFVDCISLCHKLKAQHCSLSLSGCFKLVFLIIQYARTWSIFANLVTYHYSSSTLCYTSLDSPSLDQ